MSEIDWSKAPEGATHATPKGHNYYAAFWRIVQGTATDAWVVLPDGDFDHVLLPALFERDRKELVERPSAPAWNGEGLPPVGTVCEVRLPNKPEWKRVTIKLYYEGLCVFRDERSLSVEMFHHMAFRPIRTPEQIAAEERERFAEQIVKEMGRDDPHNYPNSLNQARKMFDLGYRKVDNP